MRAAVYDRYGPPEVVHLAQVPTPTPTDNEVLIRIRATTVSSGDWRARSLNLPRGFGFMGRLVFGLTGPRQRILGSEMAGDISAIGRNVTSFKVGEPVIAFAGASGGAHAEYRTMAADGRIARKPANLSYEEAAALTFGGTTALIAVKRGKLQRGETVLVIGASGAVGSAVVQIARNLGAIVTGVTSTANVDLVKSLGADRVIDYRREDYRKNGLTYDMIVDTAGTAPFALSQGSLKPNGRLVLVLGAIGDTLRAPFVRGGKKIVAGPISSTPDDVRAMAELAAAGKFRPVVDKVYPFEEIVAAHARVDSGHKRGNVVVRIA